MQFVKWVSKMRNDFLEIRHFQLPWKRAMIFESCVTFNYSAETRNDFWETRRYWLAWEIPSSIHFQLVQARAMIFERCAVLHRLSINVLIVSIELLRNPKRFDAILIGRGAFLAQGSSVKFNCTESDHVSATLAPIVPSIFRDGDFFLALDTRNTMFVALFDFADFFCKLLPLTQRPALDCVSSSVIAFDKCQMVTDSPIMSSLCNLNETKLRRSTVIDSTSNRFCSLLPCVWKLK